MSAALAWAVGLAIVALGVTSFARNRIIRARLRFTLVAVVALAALHLGTIYVPGAFTTFTHEAAIEQLLVALALINTFVTLLFNPWFQDRAPDRSPAIVQDALV